MSTEGDAGTGGEGEPTGPAGGPRRRLDPERAAAARRAVRHPPPQVVDTRRYQRMIGLFGLLLVVIISISFLTTRGVGTAGVPAGKQLPLFAAPLAASTLNGAANLNPPCSPAKHDPGALNICLLVKQKPLVLGFFVTSSSGCEQEVDTLQALSGEFPAQQVTFAAVAVRASHADTRRAVRSHHWTIPVAYDLDGRVGATYGVEVCPILELARKGGAVTRRLIGERWNSRAALAAQVQALLRSPGPG